MSPAGGSKLPLCTAALLVLCWMQTVYVPSCTALGLVAPLPVVERVAPLPEVDPFVPRKPSPEIQKVEDEKVDEEVALEKIKEAKLRAFGAGYLAMAPKIMCAGGREKLSINFVNFSQPIDMMFSVMEEKEMTLATTPLKRFDTPCGCLEIDLPHIDQPRLTVTLTMYARRAMVQCDDFEVVDSIKIYLDACNSETFIETDKPIYKPGQKLHFRILTLQSDLKPDLSKVSKIWVESPSGIHMSQWLDVKAEDGLIDLSMPMSKDPPLGDWKIKVRHHDRVFTQTFKVGEYVLPKFEVLIKGPEYIIYPGDTEKILVCGRYTHGQPVRGTITMKISVSRQKLEPLEFTGETDRQGCYGFEVDIRKIGLDKIRYINPSYTKLVIKASLEEAATRIILEKTVDDIGITRRPFKLALSTPTSFKPGLPFSGMLLFTDVNDKPLGGESAGIVATKTPKENNELLRETLISNAQGFAFLTIPDTPRDAEYISLRAQSVDTESGSTASTSAVIKPQFSLTKSFLHITPIAEPAKVGTYQTLTIKMTTDQPENNGVFLHTVMMARGNIILSVDSIIPPEEIDGFRRPGKYGVYPVNTDEMGMKEYVHSLNMRASDIPVHFLQKEKVKTTHRRFKITYDMSPSVTVMVYYIRNDGEVVADTLSIAVEEVFQNQVNVNFADKEKRPGQETFFNVLAKPASLCAYGVVDKSVDLLGKNYRITKAQVFKALEGLQLSAEGGFADYSKRCPQGNGGGRLFGGFRSFPRPRQNLIDASQSFKDLGVVYLTNLQVETAPCPKFRPVYYRRGGPMLGMPVMAMAMADAPMMAEASVAVGNDEAPAIRSYFPETWLYSLVRVGSDGRASVPVRVPHSITEWIGHGFCTSQRFGAGVSDLTRLTAFQPFFVDLTLPYSVIRNELVPVTAVVFNYVTKCLVVKLTLQESKDFEIEDENSEDYVCVCGGESAPTSFYIKAVKLGTIKIEVHAVSVSDGDDRCRGREMDTSRDGFSDAIRKDLLVKPEGVETEQVFSAYFCPGDYPRGVYKEKIALRNLPENYVEGSERGIVTVTGDMLGPTISNLDHLLRIPTGCGEQNMIGLVPNIFIMHYLKGINQLTAAIEAKARANMKIGYQRQLKYRRTDGSYSAFGMRDKSGSTWLTAFVVRAFAQAARYIYIDKNDLEISTKWLKRQQDKKYGYFESRGRVIHKDMVGSVNDVKTLTAYVVLSLVEAGEEPSGPVIQKANKWLEQEIDIKSADMYALALASYAYMLSGSAKRDEVLARLDELVVESDDGLKHWEGRPEPIPDPSKRPYLHHQASSQHIEITSYVLLAYLRAYGKTEALLNGNPVARWIVAQRNGNGGFASTQDTVMALQALAEFGMMAYVDGKLDVKLRVRFLCKKKARRLNVIDDNRLNINGDNRLLLQTLPIPQVPVYIRMIARGPGCAMTQVILTYNVIPEEPEKPPFSITFKYEEEKDDTPAPCSTFKLNVCAQYNGEDEFSNMAVVQVRMVSGFEPDPNDILSLKGSIAPRSPKRIEQEGKDVFFYFDQLDHKDTCVEFSVRRELIVKQPRKGVVTVFDYYEKALSSSELYSFDCSGLN